MLAGREGSVCWWEAFMRGAKDVCVGEGMWGGYEKGDERGGTRLSRLAE